MISQKIQQHVFFYSAETLDLLDFFSTEERLFLHALKVTSYTK